LISISNPIQSKKTQVKKRNPTYIMDMNGKTTGEIVDTLMWRVAELEREKKELEEQNDKVKKEAKIYLYMKDYLEDSDQMGEYYNYIRECKNEDEWKDAGLPAKEASNRHTWGE